MVIQSQKVRFSPTTGTTTSFMRIYFFNKYIFDLYLDMGGPFSSGSEFNFCFWPPVGAVEAVLSRGKLGVPQKPRLSPEETAQVRKGSEARKGDDAAQGEKYSGGQKYAQKRHATTIQ